MFSEDVLPLLPPVGSTRRVPYMLSRFHGRQTDHAFHFQRGISQKETQRSETLRESKQIAARKETESLWITHPLVTLTRIHSLTQHGTNGNAATTAQVLHYTRRRARTSTKTSTKPTHFSPLFFFCFLFLFYIDFRCDPHRLRFPGYPPREVRVPIAVIMLLVWCPSYFHRHDALLCLRALQTTGPCPKFFPSPLSPRVFFA